MSKRLTESGKWQHPWFRKLPGAYKLAFYALLDLCDCAGVWRTDLDDLAYRMNVGEVEWSKFIDAMDGRIIVLDGGAKWQVRDYIAFQYGTINPNGRSGVHASVIRCLRSHGIDPTPYFSPTLASTVDRMVGPTVAPTVKDKEKDKEKDSREGESEREAPEVVEDLVDPMPAASAPVSAKPRLAKIGPHECRAPLIAAGAKIYGQDDLLGWHGVVKRCGGLDAVTSAMERMPALERADRVKVEAFMQSDRKQRRDADRLAENRDRAHQRDADERQAVTDRKGRDANSRAPLERISEYLCDPATPEGTRDRALALPTLVGLLKDVREGKFTALRLDAALGRMPELRAIAYPAETRTA